MTNFREGDVVQVINARITDEEPDLSQLARDFYGIKGTPHPYYGMLGFVFDVKQDGKICVFFSKSWCEPEPNNTPGWMGTFTADELTKIGTAPVNPPYDKIRKVVDAFSRLFAKSWNEQHGTSFETQDEVIASLVRR